MGFSFESGQGEVSENCGSRTAREGIRQERDRGRAHRWSPWGRKGPGVIHEIHHVLFAKALVPSRPVDVFARERLEGYCALRGLPALSVRTPFFLVGKDAAPPPVVSRLREEQACQFRSDVLSRHPVLKVSRNLAGGPNLNFVVRETPSRRNLQRAAERGWEDRFI